MLHTCQSQVDKMFEMVSNSMGTSNEIEVWGKETLWKKHKLNKALDPKYSEIFGKLKEEI